MQLSSSRSHTAIAGGPPNTHQLEGAAEGAEDGRLAVGTRGAPPPRAAKGCTGLHRVSGPGALVSPAMSPPRLPALGLAGHTHGGNMACRAAWGWLRAVHHVAAWVAARGWQLPRRCAALAAAVCRRASLQRCAEGRSVNGLPPFWFGLPSGGASRANRTTGGGGGRQAAAGLFCCQPQHR